MRIIITGASRGIGRALAEQFLRETENVVGLVSRNGKALRTFTERDDLPGRAILYEADVAKDPDSLADRIRHDFPVVDILVNNAGLLIRKPFHQLTEEDLRQSMEVNYLAPARLIRELLPLLRHSEIAHVVNISSMAGVQGAEKYPGLAAYSAAKGALNILTESLAVELGKEGIRVNALAPGATATEMFAEAFPGHTAPVTADEMAAWIHTFALEAWKVMNGKVVPVSLSSP